MTTIYVYKSVESWAVGDIPVELPNVVEVYPLDSGSYAVTFEKSKIMLPATVVIMTEDDFNDVKEAD